MSSTLIVSEAMKFWRRSRCLTKMETVLSGILGQASFILVLFLPYTVLCCTASRISHIEYIAKRTHFWLHYLRLPELNKILTANGAMTGEESAKLIDELVREFDKNHDGKFDYSGKLRGRTTTMCTRSAYTVVSLWISSVRCIMR